MSHTECGMSQCEQINLPFNKKCVLIATKFICVLSSLYREVFAMKKTHRPFQEILFNSMWDFDIPERIQRVRSKSSGFGQELVNDCIF